MVGTVEPGTDLANAAAVSRKALFTAILILTPAPAFAKTPQPPSAPFFTGVVERVENHVRLTGTDGKICVDTAPMMDKAWAVRAGLGWLGKHSNLITTTLGCNDSGA